MNVFLQDGIPYNFQNEAIPLVGTRIKKVDFTVTQDIWIKFELFYSSDVDEAIESIRTQAILSLYKPRLET